MYGLFTKQLVIVKPVDIYLFPVNKLTFTRQAFKALFTTNFPVFNRGTRTTVKANFLPITFKMLQS